MRFEAGSFAKLKPYISRHAGISIYLFVFLLPRRQKLAEEKCQTKLLPTLQNQQINTSELSEMTEVVVKEDSDAAESLTDGNNMVEKGNIICFKSTRGKLLLILDNFIYCQDKKMRDKIYWKCSETPVCNARVHTQGDSVIKYVNEHNHAADVNKAEAKMAYSIMKERATMSQESSQCIIDSVASELNLGEEALSQLPTTDTIKRTLRNQRKSNVFPLAQPQQAQDVVISDEYKITRSGINFLQYDSGTKCEDHILIFATSENLLLLASSFEWFGDGTIKFAPTHFFRLYIIHAVLRENCIVPVVYVLMSSQTEEMYKRVFVKLLELCPNAAPVKIYSDLDQSAIAAFRQVFPLAEVKCSHFRVCQAVYRKMQEYGVHQRYQTDGTFAVLCRTIPALAMVPLDKVEDAFDILSQILPEDLQPVMDYYEDTFFGRPTKSGVRRDPSFPAAMWNRHDEMMAETMNLDYDVDTWHRGLECRLNGCHMNMWKFLDVIRKEQSAQEDRVQKLEECGEPKSKKRKHAECAKKLGELAQSFDDMDLIAFLKGVAHTITF